MSGAGNDVYLIDRQLGVRTLRDTLNDDMSPLDAARIDTAQFDPAIRVDPADGVNNSMRSARMRRRPTAVVATSEPALPLTTDGMLNPGTLYPASDGSAVMFSLPTYQPLTIDGRHATRLKWRRPEDDPNGPIAFLTVALRGVLPAAPAGTTLREIEHQALARLIHNVQVAGGTDPNAMTEMAIELGVLAPRPDGGRDVMLSIHDKPVFDQLWQALTDPKAQARIELRCLAAAGRRSWRQVVLHRYGVHEQASLLVDKNLVVAQMVEPKKPDPAALALGMRRLAIEETAIAPHVLVAQPQLLVTPPNPALLGVAPETAIRPAALRQADLVRRLRVRPPAAPQVTPAPARPIRAIGRRPRPRPAPPAQPAPPSAAARNWRREWMRRRRRLLQQGDLTVKDKPGVPPVVITDPKQQPALMRINVTATQIVGAFTFDPQVNAYMFDVPGDLRPTVSHILLRAEFDAGGGRAPVVYYQDSAFPDRYYYEPQEFRIPRALTPPYLPQIRLAFFEVVSSDGEGDDDATINYRVRLAYRAVPHLDEFLLEQLRGKLRANGRSAQFSTLMPGKARLLLRLPSDADADRIAEAEQADADVTLDDGIVDEFELSPAGLAAVVAMLQTGGIAGRVEAALIGSDVTSIPVRLSLRETSGPMLGRAFRGPVGDGKVRVALQNRLESTVTIAELYRSPAGSAVAYPEALPGQHIPPGGSIDLDYRIVPPDADVVDLDPLLLAVVDADLAALLPRLMTNQGYSSDTFEVEVSTDPAYFGVVPPGGAEPLSGLRVEFENDTTATLDAAGPSERARLRIPILGWLLKQPDATRYRYRVVNRVGPADAARDGAASPWMEGAGALVVAPVEA
ncbi:hypothetical protein G3545_22000 [Starkeya sp. ORNL1]|uniref:hypothetical protein n=1 Tax=Starkeya sp. ORNL1 TaxID=2709380 RepID=UPI001462DD3F|nr:hypothetical protein [Starkeya sp. ORNL1]QJP16079.1 hypothetical protein G3545_22000 [Starkeya sp. ORNL1]